MLSIRFAVRSAVGLLLLATTALFLFPDSASAQKRRPTKGQTGQGRGPSDPIQGSGFIHGWSSDKGGTVTIKAKLGELDWTLKTAKNSKLRVVGMAEFEVIKPGMYIQTLALVDKKKYTVANEVPKITIISPSPANEKPKEQPKGGAAVAAAAKLPDEFELGVFPDNSGVNQFAPSDNPEAQFFSIRGQVVSVGNNRSLVVSTPVNGRMFRFTIKAAENVEVDFNITDLRVVKKDDEFTLTRGNRDVPGQNVGTLFDGTIKHLDPLTAGGTGKKKPEKEKE